MRITLYKSDLREINETLVGYLVEGRVTSTYTRNRILDERRRETVTSMYIGQRLQRLVEHKHAENLYGDGLYELVEEPPDG